MGLQVSRSEKRRSEARRHPPESKSSTAAPTLALMVLPTRLSAPAVSLSQAPTVSVPG